MSNSALSTLGTLTVGICLAVIALWPDGSSAPDVLELPTPEGLREYSISVPKAYDGQRPMPVVVVYDTPQKKAMHKHFEFEAIVVQPALGQAENSDVVFGDALLKFVHAGYNVDKAQVYVCGEGDCATRAAGLVEHTQGAVRLLDGKPRKTRLAVLR